MRSWDHPLLSIWITVSNLMLWPDRGHGFWGQMPGVHVTCVAQAVGFWRSGLTSAPGPPDLPNEEDDGSDLIGLWRGIVHYSQAESLAWRWHT